MVPGHLPGHPRYHPPWHDAVDDVVLSDNENTEADVSRLIAVDEEALFEEEEEGVSPRIELVETFKLLFAGGVAGAFSKSATAPLARLTILYQVSLCPRLTEHKQLDMAANSRHCSSRRQLNSHCLLLPAGGRLARFEDRCNK